MSSVSRKAFLLLWTALNFLLPICSFWKGRFVAQHLSEHEVRQIADYTRIGLSADEVKSMTVDLNAIIDSLDPILEFDLAGVEPTYHPIGGLTNVMREDVAEEGFTQEEALSNAPKQQDGSFLIPSILGGGDA